MMLLRLALKNFIGGGLRSFLNVFVLSLAYIGIIGMQGIGENLRRSMFEAVIAEEVGGGHIRHEAYDPYEPFIDQDTFATMPEQFEDLLIEGEGTPMLIVSGMAYPQGRMQAVTLRGIEPEQDILTLPSARLRNETMAIPVFIGRRMQRITRLEESDTFMLRWRDGSGVFDARQMQVAAVTNIDSQGLDAGNIWLPLQDLQDMMRVESAITLLVLAEDAKIEPASLIPDDEWVFESQEDLTADLRELTAMMDIELYIFYFLFISLALISVFDTQILSLFRRRKEMGTLMALGMTRKDLIRLFTLESALYAIVAVLAAAIYGTPVLWLLSKHGIRMSALDDFGIPGVTDAIYPCYNPEMITITIVIVVAVVIIVSYIPRRKIARLKPTDALRGKWS